MKKIISLFSILLFSVFLFAKNTVQSITQKENNSSNYKFKVTKKVFDDLVDAKGDSRLAIPTFVMSAKKQYVAWMNGKKTEIGLEEAAYDICISFGKDSLNALAALLGHELTHYYEKHNWGTSFASAYVNLEVSNTIKIKNRSSDTKVINETEADYLGGFLAYSAGYQTFGIMPELLNRIYMVYELPNQIVGYPSLDDRIKLAVESEMRLEELISVYQTANFMVVLGKYEEVNDYYKYILKEYQSREVYNNAGVNALAAALTLIPDGEKQGKYSYPIQIDGNSRLEVKTKNTNQAYAHKEQVTKYLTKAATYFEQAYALDSKYATSLVNLACTKDLLGNYEDAIYFANKAKRIATENQLPKVEGDAYIIKGIATIHEGDKAQGKHYLEKAKTKSVHSSDLAKLNLFILANNERPMKTAPKQKLSLTAEKIDGFDLNNFINEPDVETLLEINSNTQLGVKKLNNSTIMLHLFNGGEQFMLFQKTNENYSTATSLGIGQGSSKEEVQAKYGSPSYTLESKNGQFLVYKPKKMIISITEEGVNYWVIYRQ